MSSAAVFSLANARMGSAGDLRAWLEREGALEPEEAGTSLEVDEDQVQGVGRMCRDHAQR